MTGQGMQIWESGSGKSGRSDYLGGGAEQKEAREWIPQKYGYLEDEERKRKQQKSQGKNARINCVLFC